MILMMNIWKKWEYIRIKIMAKRTLTLQKEYITKDGKKIKGFFTVGGKHIPIVEEKPDYSSVDAWYDKHTRSWVIQKKDEEGNQVGDADYIGSKEEKDNLVKEYESKLDSSFKKDDESKLQEHFKKENERVEKWQNSRESSIEMDNGQILEHYPINEMKKMILKEAKDAGVMWEDDSISIQYTDGSVKVYVEGDDTDKIKLTDINGVIWSNANTTAFAGKGIKIENYKELYPKDYPDEKGYEDDWRMNFEHYKR